MTTIRLIGVVLLVVAGVLLALDGKITYVFLGMAGSFLSQLTPPVPKWTRLASLGATLVFVIGCLIQFHREPVLFWVGIALLAASNVAIVMLARKPASGFSAEAPTQKLGEE